MKRWRGEIADEAGVPRYCILSNDTLAELARCRPTTREELLTIKGIGPAKVERYGQTLLEIVAEAGEKGDGERGEGRGTERRGLGGNSSPSDEPRWWTVAGKQSRATSPSPSNGPAATEHNAGAANVGVAVESPQQPVHPSSFILSSFFLLDPASAGGRLHGGRVRRPSAA